MMLITTLVVSFLVCCRLEVRGQLSWSGVRVAGYSTTFVHYTHLLCSCYMFRFYPHHHQQELKCRLLKKHSDVQLLYMVTEIVTS